MASWMGFVFMMHLIMEPIVPNVKLTSSLIVPRLKAMLMAWTVKAFPNGWLTPWTSTTSAGRLFQIGGILAAPDADDPPGQAAA